MVTPFEVRWTSEVRVDDDVVFRVGRLGDELVAEWPGRLRLISDAHGERPRFERDPSADVPAVERLERGLGAALVASLRGTTSLHASVVARGGRALALLGPSGAGKSTTAAALCASGFALLRDDIAPLAISDGVRVSPGDVHHSLVSDAVEALGLRASDRQHDGKIYAATRAASEPAELVAVVSLRFDETPRPLLRRLGAVSAIEALLPCVVRFVVDEPARNAGELERLARLCGQVPVFELRRSRDLTQLGAAVTELASLARGAAR